MKISKPNGAALRRPLCLTLALVLSAGWLGGQDKPSDLADTPRLAARQGPREGDDTVYITTGPTGVSHFDVDGGVIIFTGDVVVDHPQFHITCDELTLFLKDEEESAALPAEGEAAAAEAAPPAEEPAAEEAEEGESPGDVLGLAGSSIEKAIATGRKVVIRKLAGEEGKSQIGQCRHATYDGTTGDMTLREWAQVQRGNHLVIGTVRSTQIMLRNTGQHEVIGSSETRIVRGEAGKQ